MMEAMTPAGGKCAICGKLQDKTYRPFCSKRCADVDLNRWFTGAYAVPAVEADDDGEGDPFAGDV